MPTRSRRRVDREMGLPDGRSMVTVSAMVFVPFASRQDTPMAPVGEAVSSAAPMLYVLCGRRASAIRKLEVALAIATIAAVSATIVIVLIRNCVGLWRLSFAD